MAGIKGRLTDPLLSVVMPVYNERETIEGMIARVLAVPGIRIELIVVDDGSKDGTLEILGNLQARYRFKLCQKPNGGKGSALRLGFKEVTGDLVVIQDADTEYSPEEFPDLIEPHLPGPRRRGVRIALSRPPPGVPLHALPREPVPHVPDQRPLQHDADRHGDLL
jgi:glycosyltransferase involved in cell wall biosynthesis